MVYLKHNRVELATELYQEILAGHDLGAEVYHDLILYIVIIKVANGCVSMKLPVLLNRFFNFWHLPFDGLLKFVILLILI